MMDTGCDGMLIGMLQRIQKLSCELHGCIDAGECEILQQCSCCQDRGYLSFKSVCKGAVKKLKSSQLWSNESQCCKSVRLKLYVLQCELSGCEKLCQ